MVLVPEIKLIRTDTTLDLSQKAEKVWLSEPQNFFLFLSRIFISVKKKFFFKKKKNFTKLFFLQIFFLQTFFSPKLKQNDYFNVCTTKLHDSSYSM